MPSAVTGINPTTGPVKHGTIIVQGPKGLGSGVLDTNYRIDTYVSNLPVLDDANVPYSGRFKDITYYTA